MVLINGFERRFSLKLAFWYVEELTVKLRALKTISCELKAKNQDLIAKNRELITKSRGIITKSQDMAY